MKGEPDEISVVCDQAAAGPALAAWDPRQERLAVWVDATPDGGYALRILRAFRHRCEACFLAEGLPADRTAVYERMNQDQERRAAELDRALELLEALPDE